MLLHTLVRCGIVSGLPRWQKVQKFHRTGTLSNVCKYFPDTYFFAANPINRISWGKISVFSTFYGTKQDISY